MDRQVLEFLRVYAPAAISSDSIRKLDTSEFEIKTEPFARSFGPMVMLQPSCNTFAISSRGFDGF